MIDTVDLKILNLLRENARMTWSELAGKLGLSSPSTAERVHRLENYGVIKGYYTAINFHSLGYTLVAFIAVDIGHPKHRKKFIDSVARYAEVEECHHIAGDEDYFLKVRCFDTAHLDELLNRLKQIPGVLKTKTTIVLSSAKEISKHILLGEKENVS